MQNILVKYATDKREEWDEYLDTCVYAYNTSVQESTHFSPFEVMFGRKPTMPIDIDMATNPPEDRLQNCIEAGELSASQVEAMASQRQEVLQQVKANIKQAQEKQKEYYDRKHANPAAYKVGAKVLKKDFRRKKRKGGKMDTRFVGPYIITNNVGKGLYSLKLVENPTVVVERVNGAHLKPYQTPPQSPTSSFTSEEGDSLSANRNQSCENEEGASHNDSIPPLPPAMPPLSSLKRPLEPKSSSQDFKPPSKKPHTSPTEDDTLDDHPELNTTYTKCPDQPPKHSSPTQQTTSS